MEWKKNTQRYACGELLMLGPWNVGGVDYSGSTSKDDPKKWAATCKLPGIKNVLAQYETPSAAKDRVEKAVRHWLSQLPQNQTQ